MKKILLFCFFIVLAFNVKVFSQSYSVVNNFRIYPSATTQTEPVVCISPVNPNIIFVSAVTIYVPTVYKSEGVYVSTDRGATWRGDDTCTGTPYYNQNGSPGVAINNNGTFILTHNGTFIPGAYGHYSTDLGITWSTEATLFSSQPDDKCIQPTVSDNYGKSLLRKNI